MQISRWVLPRHQYGTRNYMKGNDIDALVDYIDREPELKALLQVAQNIGGLNIFSVDFAYFGACLHSGRVTVHWHCQMGEGHFDMHMTLAKWNVQKWKTAGGRNIDGSGIFNFDVAEKTLLVWKKECLGRLEAIDHLTLSRLIGTPTFHGGWRFHMYPEGGTRTLMLWSQCGLNNSLGLTEVNDIKDIHFPLDQWRPDISRCGNNE